MFLQWILHWLYIVHPCIYYNHSNMLEPYWAGHGGCTVQCETCHARRPVRRMRWHVPTQYLDAPPHAVFFCDVACETRKVQLLHDLHTAYAQENVLKNGWEKVGRPHAQVCFWCGLQCEGSWDKTRIWTQQDCARCKHREGSHSCCTCDAAVMPVTDRLGRLQYYAYVNTLRDSHVRTVHAGPFQCGDCQERETTKYDSGSEGE